MADQVGGQFGEGFGRRIALKRFPGSQMGPAQQHYDFVRTGQAGVAWFLHGATPGRFPLTEIVRCPILRTARSIRQGGAQATATCAVAQIRACSFSRVSGSSFLESSTPRGMRAGSRMTAAATTGPASGPLPA